MNPKVMSMAVVQDVNGDDFDTEVVFPGETKISTLLIDISPTLCLHSDILVVPRLHISHAIVELIYFHMSPNPIHGQQKFTRVCVCVLCNQCMFYIRYE